MEMITFPAVRMPKELVVLLKSNMVQSSQSNPVLKMLRENRAIYMLLEKTLGEFDAARAGVDKVYNTLGWPHFRERLTSLFVHKAMYGAYPEKTDMEIVEDIHAFETRYAHLGVTSYSRVFLLGLWLKFVNIELQHKSSNNISLKVPEGVLTFLALSQGRVERADWLILLCWHLMSFLGGEICIREVKAGKDYSYLYQLLKEDQKKLLLANLLAYGASIDEAELFTYDKI